MNKLFLWGFCIFSVFWCAGCTSVVKGLVNTQPKVEFKEEDYEKPEVIVQGDAVFYNLEEQNTEISDPDLRKYAPVVVQGFQKKQNTDDQYSYSYWADGIGSPFLTQDGSSVGVDTQKPALFCRIEYAEVLGTKLKQLVYVFWYPERPVGTLETGKVDGNILRITLDASGYPSIFEYSQTCGCFHGTFVANHLESWAMEEFGKPIEGKSYVVEKKALGKTDWLVRDLITVFPEARPVLFISAGSHFCHAIRFSHQVKNDSSYKSYRYQLRPYDSLTRVPRQGGDNASIFNEEGLVIGGKRWKEEIFMSSLKNPGWPRHLDKTLIHWDESQWTDPKLIENHLRLPKQIISTEKKEIQAHLVAKKQANSNTLVPEEVCKVCDTGKPYLLIFTHSSCVACRSFKKDILPLAQVQRVLKRCNCILLDVSEEKNRLLADRYRVDITPTFIAFDKDARETKRGYHLNTAEKFIEFLEYCFPQKEAQENKQAIVLPKEEKPVVLPKEEKPIVLPKEEKPIVLPKEEKPAFPENPISFQKFPAPLAQKLESQEKKLSEKIQALGEKGKAYLLLFTHKMCTGCKQFKKQVLLAADVKKALQDWNYVELDMFDPENAQLGESYHVEITPSILLFSPEGDFFARNEDLETKEGLLAFLSTHKGKKL
ncbi:MAG: thioredoxin fold domain-containing protein [Candidatus Brocadiae bacterium]|nr:thioredoxin fold domain-containing protein [Candidatus Brocadiia bacterium]